MRRAAIFQRLQQEAELLVGLVLINAEQCEHRLLHLGRVYADGTTADFRTVKHQVVAPGHSIFRRRQQCFGIVHRRRREGVVHGHQAPAFGIALEHREFGNPQRRPARFNLAQVLADPHQQMSHEGACFQPLSGTEEQDVTSSHSRGLRDPLPSLSVEELDDRRLQALQPGSIVVDLDPGQSLGPVTRHVFAIGVYLFARQAGPARHPQRCDALPLIVGGSGKYPEINLSDMFINVHQLHRNPQVRLVGTVLIHRVPPVKAGKGGFKFNLEHLMEHLAQHVLCGLLDGALGNKGQLHIELRKLRLPVRPQVLVPEATRNLVIAVHAGHHQQLFKQLRRLRQGEEFPRVDPAWHQVVTRAFRRRARQDRCFKFGKPVFIKVIADGAIQGGAKAQVFLHSRAPQIEIAVAQADFLTILVRHQQRQWRRGIEQCHLGGQHFDPAGGHCIVPLVLGAHSNGTGNLYAVFIPQPLGACECRAFRLNHDLDNAAVIPQAEENQPTQIAAGINPATERDGLTRGLFR